MTEPKIPRPDLHTVISSEEADKNCKTERGFVGINCEHCDRRYVVHCERCLQQVTGCACTIESTMNRIKAQNQEEEEKRPWLESHGFWVPPSARNN